MLDYLSFLVSRTEYKKDFNIFSAFSLYDKYIKQLKMPRIIQILGTNGKGSCGRFLARLLIANGFSCGHFSSPHIKDFAERFYINGQNASELDIELAHKELKALMGEDFKKLSYFEYACFLSPFIFKNCDFLVFEAGLGGEYDATSAFKATLCVYTKIAKDHCELLGNDITQIARTKLKAARSDFLYSHKNDKVLLTLAINLAKLRGVKLINEQNFLNLPSFSDKNLKENISELKDKLSLLDKTTSIAIIENSKNPNLAKIDPQLLAKIKLLSSNLELLEKNLSDKKAFDQEKQNICKQLEKDAKNLPSFLKENANLAINAFYILTNKLPSSLPSLDLSGRIQKIRNNLYLDVGHNQDAAIAICEYFKNQKKHQKLILIFNCFKDKDAKAMLKELSLIIKKVELLKPKNPARPMYNEALEPICLELGLKFASFEGINEKDTYLVFGSFALAAEFLDKKELVLNTFNLKEECER